MFLLLESRFFLGLSSSYGRSQIVPVASQAQLRPCMLLALCGAAGQDSSPRRWAHP